MWHRAFFSGGRPAGATTVRTQDMCRITRRVGQSTTEPTVATLALTQMRLKHHRPITESKKLTVCILLKYEMQFTCGTLNNVKKSYVHVTSSVFQVPKQVPVLSGAIWRTSGKVVFSCTRPAIDFTLWTLWLTFAQFHIRSRFFFNYCIIFKTTLLW